MKASQAVSIAAALFALGMAAPALTQTCGPGLGPCGGNGAGYGPGARGGGPGAYGNPTARAEARLEALRTQLNLGSSQQSAWQAYADAVRAQAADMAEHRAQMQAGPGTAPERVAARAEIMRERAAGMAQVSHALGALYDVLDANQRALLDRNLAAGPGMGRRPGPLTLR